MCSVLKSIHLLELLSFDRCGTVQVLSGSQGRKAVSWLSQCFSCHACDIETLTLSRHPLQVFSNGRSASVAADFLSPEDRL